MAGTTIAYYVRNRQCIPVISALNQYLPGLVVTGKPYVTRYFLKETPVAPIAIYSLNPLTRLFPSLKICFKPLSILTQADVVITGTTDIPLIRRCFGKKIMVFHGTYRCIMTKQARELMLFDEVWVNSPRQARMLAHHWKDEKKACVLIGYLPFLNFKDKTPENCASIKKTLGIDSTRPVVVYLPARRGVGSWCAQALNIARQMPEDMQLIMRPHPTQISRMKGNESALLNELKQLIATGRSILLDVGDYPYNDLLCIADLVISDATSPAEESLYYDAAQLFTDSNSAQVVYKECMQGGMLESELQEVLKLYDCGVDLNRQSFSNWGEAIRTALAKKDDFAANRRAYFTHAFGTLTKADTIARLKETVSKLSDPLSD